MATLKLRRGIRIPVVTPTKTPTKKATKKAAKKRAPTTVRRTTTLKDRIEGQLAEIAARLENVDTEEEEGADHRGLEDFLEHFA